MALRLVRLTLLAIGLAAALACDRGSAQQIAPLTPPETVPPAGVPELFDLNTGKPAKDGSVAVEFGTLRIGSERTRSVAIRNSGTAAFTIVRIESSSHANAFEYSDHPFTVSAGQRSEFAITFRPTSGDECGETVHLVIADAEPSEFTVRLHGVGEAPRQSPAIDVAPAELEFGKVAVGTYRVQQLTVANVGVDVPGTEKDNLVLAIPADGVWVEKRAEIVGLDAADFALMEWPPVGYLSGMGLSESQDVLMRVRFSPTTGGRKSADLVIYSNDPNTPQLNVHLGGIGANLPPCDFAVRPPALNFGAVDPGKYLTLNFEIANVSSGPDDECLVAMLDRSIATAATNAFTLVNGPIETAIIRAGEVLSIPVRFQPKQDGVFTGEVEFYISNPMDPEVKVPLTGVGRADCLMVAPAELDFGSIGVHCRSRQRAFTIYNSCGAALSVTSIRIATETDVFELTKLPALPVTIAGGASSEFGVTFSPKRVGDSSAQFAVSVSGSAVPFSVNVTGRGMPDVMKTDVFSQAAQPKVDVLFVVDNSATMADKQANLAANLGHFVDYAVQQPVDFHIAVTTTDVTATGEAGRLLPLSGTNPRFVTPTTPNAALVLKQNLNVGTSGSEVESLIRPAYLALTNPLLSGHNAGFYRDDAKLAVVIVSDAADQDPLGFDEVFYESFLYSLKGLRRRNDTTVSAIIPRQAQAAQGCSYDSASAGLDTRVSSLVADTAGLIDDICSPNWAPTLEHLGTCLYGLRTTFFLSNVPNMSLPDPITITIDGQRYAQYDAQGAIRWDYNQASNAIEFAPLAAPPAGSELRVTYYVACQ